MPDDRRGRRESARLRRYGLDGRRAAVIRLGPAPRLPAFRSIQAFRPYHGRGAR